MSYTYRTPRCVYCQRAATEQTSAGYLCPACAAKPDSPYWKGRVQVTRASLSHILTIHDLQSEWQEYAESLGDFGEWTWQAIANEFERKLAEWESRYEQQPA